MNRQILLYKYGGERSEHKVKGHQNLAKYYIFKPLCELGKSKVTELWLKFRVSSHIIVRECFEEILFGGGGLV